MYEKIGVVANRLPSLDVKEFMDTGDIPVLSYIPSDNDLAEFDLKGENVFFLPESSSILQGAREALKNLDVL
mgnify:FL=1